MKQNGRPMLTEGMTQLICTSFATIERLWVADPPCEFTCSDTSCLPESSLVCNGVADCLDESDEVDCPSSKPQSGSSSSLGNNSNDSSRDGETCFIFSYSSTVMVIPCLLWIVFETFGFM